MIFRERESDLSLDFRPIGPSVLDGARSKAILHSEGYAWIPFGGVPTTPRDRDLFLLLTLELLHIIDVFCEY